MKAKGSAKTVWENRIISRYVRSLVNIAISIQRSAISHRPAGAGTLRTLKADR
jgi:hypothetical protein